MRISATQSALLITAMLVIDSVWIMLMAPMYKRLAESVQGTKFYPRMHFAAVAYVLMALALIFTVVPQLPDKGGGVADAIRVGGLAGLVIYGIYNATNMTMFTRYSGQVAIIDTLWGTVLFSVLAYACMMGFAANAPA